MADSRDIPNLEKALKIYQFAHKLMSDEAATSEDDDDAEPGIPDAQATSAEEMAAAVAAMEADEASEGNMMTPE